MNALISVTCCLVIAEVLRGWYREYRHYVASNKFRDLILANVLQGTKLDMVEPASSETELN